VSDPNSLSEPISTVSGVSAIQRLEQALDGNPEVRNGCEVASALVHLRSVIEAVDRRESSIELLHRTAADIISERHVDEVIVAAVDRAHKLLACDLAYLALYDPKTHGTYVKAASGNKSSRFTELRVPFGLGVGGVVARTLAPFETADYLNDRRFGHIAGVDSGIADEDIRAMAGAPMLVGSEFVGAIFAANRTVRHFTAEELKQLSTLGAFVGLALSNARMLEAREQALAETQNAYSVLQRRNEATAQMAKLHEKMLEAITGGSHVGAVADIVSASIGLQVHFFEAERNAGLSDWFARLDVDTSEIEPAYRTAMDISLRNGSCQRLDLPGSNECYIVAVGNGETNYGALAAVGAAPLTGTHQRSLERAALTCALLLGRAREIQFNAFRGWSRSFQQFMLGAADTSDRDLSLFEQFFEGEAPILVICLRPATQAFDKVFYRCAVVAQANGGFAAEHAARVYLILPGDADPEEIRTTLQGEIGQDINVGLASSGMGLAEIRGAIVDALRAQTFLDQRGSIGVTARFSELGQLILLMQGKTDTELNAMVDATLAPLLQYDIRSNTSLVKTLEVYFNSGNNAHEAAKILGVHPKTLVQRLDRIGILLRKDWRRGQTSLDLRVALRIHTYLAAAKNAAAAAD